MCPAAWFGYYKPFLLPSGGIDDDLPVQRNAFAAERWMELKCNGDQGIAGRGVEWDWLDFLYNVTSEHTTNYTTPGELQQIYRRACSGSPSTACNASHPLVEWENLRASAETQLGGVGNPRYERFRNTGRDWGVDPLSHSHTGLRPERAHGPFGPRRARGASL